MMALLWSIGGSARWVCVRKRPSRASVGLKVGLLMITGNGKSFSSKERKIAEQPGQIGFQREDPHAVFGLLRPAWRSS